MEFFFHLKVPIRLSQETERFIGPAESIQDCEHVHFGKPLLDYHAHAR